MRVGQLHTGAGGATALVRACRPTRVSELHHNLSSHVMSCCSTRIFTKPHCALITLALLSIPHQPLQTNSIWYAILLPVDTATCSASANISRRSAVIQVTTKQASTFFFIAILTPRQIVGLIFSEIIPFSIRMINFKRIGACALV